MRTSCYSPKTSATEDSASAATGNCRRIPLDPVYSNGSSRAIFACCIAHAVPRQLTMHSRTWCQAQRPTPWPGPPDQHEWVAKCYPAGQGRQRSLNMRSAPHAWAAPNVTCPIPWTGFYVSPNAAGVASEDPGLSTDAPLGTDHELSRAALLDFGATRR
jgi:hypothetical protein